MSFDEIESTAARLARRDKPTVPHPASQSELAALAKQVQAEIELSVEQCVAKHVVKAAQLRRVRNWTMLGLAVVFSMGVVIGSLALRLHLDVVDLQEKARGTK